MIPFRGNGAIKATSPFLVILALSACASQPTLQTGATPPSLRITSIEVIPPGPNEFRWAARETATFGRTDECPEVKLSNSNTPYAYDAASESAACGGGPALPETAKAEIRAEYAELVKRDLQSKLTPRLNGERGASLSVRLTELKTQSGAETFVGGSAGSLTGSATVTDNATGETLGRIDDIDAVVGNLLGGVIGVAIESNKAEMGMRLSQDFAEKTCIWLTSSSERCA